MEHRYEDQSPAAKAGGLRKPYIDFYRQPDPSGSEPASHGFQGKDTQEESYGHLPLTDGLRSGSDYDQQHKFFSQLKNDNYVQPELKHDLRKEEYRKALQDKAQAALKRRSVESTEAIIGNRQNEANANSRAPKSALGQYPSVEAQKLQVNSGQGTLKQISKNKIERDLVMEQAYQGQTGSNSGPQQLFQNSNNPQQQQTKRTLAKSQSQNRLVLVSHESLMNKGNHYNDLYDVGENQPLEKNSFSDKSLVDRTSRGTNPTGQDPLFKQHLQYASGSHSHNLHHQQKAWQLKAQSNNVLSHITTKDCTYCNKTGGIHSHSMVCQATFCIKDSLGMMIQNGLSKRYSTNRDYYNLKIINDLIYNENTHIVSIFKDYLILDDINEFLKRSYNYSETKVRLPKLCSFYDKYSQVFPNFVILPESKYMFKNIQRKQKLIDEQYQLQEEVARRAHQTLLDEDRLFNSRFYNSVYRLDMSLHQYEDQAKSIAEKAGKPKRIDQMKIEELVDRFLLKDSESNIQLQTESGLNFSGFTQQSMIQEKTTPSKSRAMPTKYQPQPYQPQTRVTSATTNLGSAAVGQRKESVQKKIQMVEKQSIGMSNKGREERKQKGSFAQTQSIKPVLKTNEVAKQQVANQSSSKTTPRLNNKPIEEPVTKIQTSPATKEALANYLQQCQIDLTAQTPHLQVLDHDSLHSPSSLPSNIKVLGSTTSLSHPHSLSVANRPLLKSQQCVIPTISLGQKAQEITNLKKTTRLSGGNQQFKPGQAQTSMSQKKTISPVPQLQSQQQLTTASRNLVTNSTQKSLKSVNSHAKYLSGGSEQYQKLLQNPYATQDTVNSQQFSGKKPQVAKAILETFQSKPEVPDEGLITGEDCDDAGIADERFASPEIYSTSEDPSQRKSLQRGQNPILLTSCEDNRLLSQCQNYDQIKKHLEQYITHEGSQKKMITTMSSEKPEGYNRLQMASSATSNNEANNSRNGTAQKHFESLKQKIRGVFEQESVSKTPNKSSTVSKKGAQQPTILAQNRMSIESKDMMQLLAPQQQHGSLSSTSAAGRTLSFAQFGQSQNQYRSITNMQQRKNSKPHQQQESSVESKRLSQNRQSFKDIEKLKRCATAGKTLTDMNQQTFGQISLPISGQPTTTLSNPTFIGKHQQQPSISSTQAANTVRVMTPSYSLASLSKLISPTTGSSPITMTVTLAGQGRKQNMKKPVQQNQHQLQPTSTVLITSASHQNFMLDKKVVKSTTNLQSKTNRNVIQAKPQQQLQPQVQMQIQRPVLPQQQKLQQSASTDNFQITPRSLYPAQLQPKPYTQLGDSQNMSCTISTENNSSKTIVYKVIAAKAIESKHPKFMRTIEEGQPATYNTMLSASMGHRKSGTGLTGSISQAQLDIKTKQKIQTVVNSNQASIKRSTNNMGMTLSSSASVSHFKSPSQQIQTKKQTGRYM